MMTLKATTTMVRVNVSRLDASRLTACNRIRRLTTSEVTEISPLITECASPLFSSQVK